MIKNFVTSNETGLPTDEDLKLINNYSLRPLKKEEVFVFSVILCDNDIDRDFEKFSVASLQKLKELFVGKTGILNHSMQSEDQSTRTFRTELITDNTKITADGEKYTYLKAWCYTVRSEKNNALISDIESGIKKEVSISCSAKNKVCSVCGETVCSHRSGKSYDGKLCFKTIDNITDAYEWSFVAVPAQKNAGVTKSLKFGKENVNMENILKSLCKGSDVTLKSSESIKLFDYIKRLESLSADGKKYRQEITKKTKKYFAITLPQMEEKCIDDILKGISSENMENLCACLSKKASEIIPPAPQLYKDKSEKNNNKNNEFKF